MTPMGPKLFVAAGALCGLISALPAHAQQSVAVEYINGKFRPGELHAPSDQPLVLRVKNLDSKAMEFESNSLRVEKVVAAKSAGIINIRPLKPGRYEFYDDFNATARGVLNIR